MKRDVSQFARIFVNSWLVSSAKHATVDEQGREELQKLAEQALKLSYKMGVEDQKTYGPGGFWRRLKLLFKGELR